MKRCFLILTSLLFCLSVLTPVFAQDEPRREKKTDRKIDRKTDRETERKEDRRDEVRGRGTPHSERATDRRIDRRTEREGERKEERRDEVRGMDLKDDAENQGNGEKEIKPKAGHDLYNENSQQRKASFDENMPQRRALYNENSSQRKELKTSLDTSGDGRISKDEIAGCKVMVQALYEENSAERQGLHNENKNERKNLISENSSQRKNLLNMFDFDKDGKISKEEMEEADSILDSMAE